MSSKNLTKSAMAVLGCAGAAVAAPFIAPYLATLSLPFFGAVLAGVINNNEFKKKLGDAISNTAAGLMTEIGGHFATDKLPRALSSKHNFHLERMLATAYFNSLEAIEEEIKADEDEVLQEQFAKIIPSLKARIKRGLKEKELSALFPSQSPDQSTGTTFANRYSAEKVTLLVADEVKWREQLGEEAETVLRRWLNEQREVEEQSARFTQLSLTRDTRLYEPLRLHLRAEMPHRIAHQISELVKREDFKESWIAFQRAHLQGIVRVVERIDSSQSDIKESVDALAQRIESFANHEAQVAAIAGKLEEFLRQSHLPQEKLALLVEQQTDELINELRGIEERLKKEIEESKTEVVAAVGHSEKVVVSEIRGAATELKEEFQKAILQDARRVARNRLKQLPAPPRDFTGREAELEELRRALRQSGVTISGVQGMGGVGKTALALVLADEFKDQYRDAQIYLDLKGVSAQPLSPAEVMWHVVSSFHPDMKRPDDADLPAWYNALLNDNRVLLLYDNAAGAEQIEPLLPPKHCLLLVTSRRHFKVPGMFDKDINEMTEGDAEALLLEVAPRISTDAAAIAKQCGYLPLALRLAASALHKSHALSPSDLLRRLQDKRKRVELVEASFSLSYELLSEELQRRWRSLAIFPTDFDAPAAAAVWQTDVDAAKESLAELEEYSLLDWEETAHRYTLHDLARDFADTRLSATEREQAGLLHAAHYLQILSTADKLYLKGKETIAGGLSLFDNERVNIEAGQAWAAARFADNERAARLCNWYPGAGIYVLTLRQHPRDFIRWHEAALSAARQLKDYAAEGRHLGNLGYAYDDLGEYRRAIGFYEQRLDIAREIGDRRGEGNALGNLGVAYKNLGEMSRAIEFYEQRLDIAREIGDRRGEGNALGNLGNVYTILGEARRAIELYEQHLAITREMGDRRGEGTDLGNLGLAYAALGETQRAIESYEQALVVLREIDDRRGEGAALGNLGLAYDKLGEATRAIEFYKQQLLIAREVGDRRGEGNALSNIGVSYGRLGAMERAIESMEAALKIFEEIEAPSINTVRKNLEMLRGKSR